MLRTSWLEHTDLLLLAVRCGRVRALGSCELDALVCCDFGVLAPLDPALLVSIAGAGRLAVERAPFLLRAIGRGVVRGTNLLVVAALASLGSAFESLEVGAAAGCGASTLASVDDAVVFATFDAATSVSDTVAAGVFSGTIFFLSLIHI